MRISFSVEMSYPIFGVVDSFLAFLYLYLSLAVKFSFSERGREREIEQAYDVETTSMRHHDVASTLVQHCFKVVCPLRERGRGVTSSCWK